MRTYRWLPLVLGLVLAACTEQSGGPSAPPIFDPVGNLTTEIQGILDVEGDSSIALLWAGRVVPLLGVDPAHYAALDDAEVVVQGQWEGEAFRAYTVEAASLDQPTEEPELRIP
jgi:hypothetical protein